MSAFLTAEWRHLLMLNWAVDPQLLEGRVPVGTRLDPHDGKTWVSLVAFLMLDTRVKGVAVPFHTNFEEVNLRFYVRRDAPDPKRGTSSRRGVVFVRELVPRAAIAAIARLAYQEHYRAARMWHRRTDEWGTDIEAEHPLDQNQRMVYGWQAEGGEVVVAATVDGDARALDDGSHAQFIAEHYWGYAAQRDGGTVEYEVEHPPWQVHDLRDVAISGDLAWEYGSVLGGALSRPPDTAFVAAGSAVVVADGERRTL